MKLLKMVFRFIGKVIVGILKLLIMPFKFVFRKFQLWDMDMQWSLHGGNCFELFPPSFYCTHTQEEIDRITEEKLAELTEMVEDLKIWEKEHNEKEARLKAEKEEKLAKKLAKKREKEREREMRAKVFSISSRLHSVR